MQQILDEMIEKIETLSDEEVNKLSDALIERKNKGKKKGYVSPDTIWVKENRADYQGKYVALSDGELVGTGKNYPEALADAKKNGIDKPMITYIFPLDSKPFGGW